MNEPTIESERKWTFDLSGDRLVEWIRVVLADRGIPNAVVRILTEAALGRWQGRRVRVTVETLSA